MGQARTCHNNGIMNEMGSLGSYGGVKGWTNRNIVFTIHTVMPIFRKKTVEKPIVVAAREIVENNSHALLKVAWDEYLHIKKMDEAYDDDVQMRQITPMWFALKRIVELRGKLENLEPEDKLLFKHLKNGHLIYNEILHALIDHHNNEAEGARLLESHPELYDHLPEHLGSSEQVMNVMVEVIRQYKVDLEQFSYHFWSEIKPFVEQ